MKLVPRKVKAPDFVPGESSTVELEKTRVVAYWLLSLGYRFNVTGGTGAGSFHSDAHARLIKKFIAYGGGGPLQQTRGQFLNLFTLLFMQEVLAQTNPTALAAGTAQAGREAVILIPAIMGHSNHPEEFGFPPLSDPSMSFDWGDADDLALGADGALSIDQLTSRMIEFSYDEPRVPAADPRTGRGGGYAPLLVFQQRQSVVGTQELEFKLGHIASAKDGGPGHELRALFVETFKGIQAGGRDAVYDNGVVTSVETFEIAGRERYKQVSFADMQQVNKVDYGLASKQTGLIVLDSAADRKTTKGELWTQQGRATPRLVVNAEQQGSDQNDVVVTSVYTFR